MAHPMPAGTATTLDWENNKATITKLWSSNKLQDVMRIMRDEYGFQATVKQYKTQFRKWGIDTKRIEAPEYKAILRKKRKREQEEWAKSTQFELHGEIVPASKIARFENRMLKAGKITADETFSEVGTPPSLTYRTPTPSIASSSPRLGFSALSPPRKSTTPSLDRHLSKSPLVPHWTPPSSACVLFAGTVDDLIQRPDDQSLWRPLLTPLPGFTPSPVLSNLHGVVSSSTSIPRTAAPPTLEDSAYNLYRTLPITVLPASSQMPGSPSLSKCHWWPSFVDFAASPLVPSFPGPARHRLEEIFREVGKRAENYEDGQFYIELRRQNGCSGESCAHNKFAYITTRVECDTGSILVKLALNAVRSGISASRIERLVRHTLLAMLQEINPSIEFFGVRLVLIISIAPELANPTVILDFVESIIGVYSSLYAVLEYARCCSSLQESLWILQCVTGNDYVSLRAIYERWAFQCLVSLGFEDAVAVLTGGHVRVKRDEHSLRHFHMSNGLVERSGNGLDRTMGHCLCCEAGTWDITLGKLDLHARVLQVMSHVEDKWRGTTSLM
ncbi:hypothetical protein BDV95DRAFT_66032 [Massariosphaeria phaeospora]|uniref:Clr5 domain-containing protein n=1 Tax=Massariosphaeria phaeospora TaxID=100035 RepID=A0A7C8I9I2_9PLEO|nr:hypothetical protein BDV95DRAFT_66032 [Massariosphaeria phaeospora]